MSINLSDLTSPNNQDVLAEITSAADFLDPIGKLENLSRGSNKGGHALQTVALNQPRALPLDANGKGYLYLSGVSGNDANVPDAANLDGFGDFTLQVDNLYLPDWTPSTQVTTLAKGSSWKFSVHTSGSFRLDMSGVSSVFSDPTGLADKTTASIRAVRAGSVFTFFYSLNDGVTWVSVPFNFGGGSGVLTNVSQPLSIGSANLSSTVLGKVSGAKVWNNATQSGSPVLDVDFTATKISHNDTKFACATGQVVTINQSGNDPSTIIKKSVLRFANKSDDSTSIALQGLLNQTIDGGYMFAAFSVLGDGGEAYSRIFSVNSNGADDNTLSGGIFSLRNAATSTLDSYYQGNYRLPHVEMFDDANGDILHEVKITNGNQSSLVNDANLQTATLGTAISSEEFNIVSSAAPSNANNNAAIDLEFLALFSADSVPDEATAKRIRDYINGRGANLIFSLIDSAAFYFYDATRAPSGAISSGSSAWSGRVVGSDNGDSASLLATQATSNDAPVSDGYTVTFADNTDHLDIPSISQSGYQIVGSSFGTFVYRINGTTAVTELNLLGNLGASSQRKSGDLYGIILLPESATGKDIQEARKLLIDRGASDAATQNHLYAAWHTRNDIVEFQNIAMPQINQLSYTFSYMPNLVSFPAMSFPVGLYFANAWDLNTSMSDFGAIQAPLGNNFTSAWQGTTALQSFPAGAKLGTAANNVNFDSAWRQSGLTSFSTPLPTAANVTSAWYGCTSLESFSSSLPTASNVSFSWYNSAISSFSSELPLATNVFQTWSFCGFLTSFDTPLPSATLMNQAWRNCTALTDFSDDVFANWNPSSISSQVFHATWDGCTSLTAQSVENILVSLNNSGQHATSTGASGGTALADAGIDIDYNVATGSLSAATNAAVTSLKAKGWSIVVNNVTL